MVVLGIRVIFHLGRDVWCIVFSSDLGHVSVRVVIVSTSGSCSQLSGHFPVDFLLPERALCA